MWNVNVWLMWQMDGLDFEICIGMCCVDRNVIKLFSRNASLVLKGTRDCIKLFTSLSPFPRSNNSEALM